MSSGICVFNFPSCYEVFSLLVKMNYRIFYTIRRTFPTPPKKWVGNCACYVAAVGVVRGLRGGGSRGGRGPHEGRGRALAAVGGGGPCEGRGRALAAVGGGGPREGGGRALAAAAGGGKPCESCGGVAGGLSLWQRAGASLVRAVGDCERALTVAAGGGRPCEGCGRVVGGLSWRRVVCRWQWALQGPREGCGRALAAGGEGLWEGSRGGRGPREGCGRALAAAGLARASGGWQEGFRNSGR